MQSARNPQRASRTFVEIADSPISLAVPEKTQIDVSDDVVLAKALGLQEDQAACSLCPFGHEAVVFQARDTIRVSIEAKQTKSALPCA
jgi:hypothetical protein